MVAAFDIMLDTAGTTSTPGTSTIISAITPAPQLRFKRADDALINTANPNVIPDAGITYSRWKSLYLKCTIAPDVNVSAVYIYSDGSAPTGIDIKVGNETPTHTALLTTGYDVSSTNDSPMTNHASITAVTTLYNFTSGSTKTVSISEAGNIIDAINETSDYVVLQMEVGPTASPGDLADETITWEYDET